MVAAADSSSARSAASSVPMDHSYREINGNFADDGVRLHRAAARLGAPQAAIVTTATRQPIDHSMPKRRAHCRCMRRPISTSLLRSLFFVAKIQETARKLGVKVGFLKNEKDATRRADRAAKRRDKPALIVFDLNNANAKPLTLIPKLKTKLKKSASIIGFLSHLQGDLKAKAVEAGCDTVMPRAAFSQNLPNLLRRYSVEEGEEINYNQ